MKKPSRYFSKTDIILWISSVVALITAFCLFDKENYATLFACITGVTSLIFNAKGNPVGQALMIIFSLIYGAVSYGFAYYGEMVTYLGMTLPMAALALISWLKNPFRGEKAQVRVNILSLKQKTAVGLLSIPVTVIFYFILGYFSTANLLVSTLSVTTSFIAAALTFLRSPFFALAYAGNDIVLIILWSLASFSDRRYICVVICFVVFLVNDTYTFISWQKMKKRQRG